MAKADAGSSQIRLHMYRYGSGMRSPRVIRRGVTRFCGGIFHGTDTRRLAEVSQRSIREQWRGAFFWLIPNRLFSVVYTQKVFKGYTGESNMIYIRTVVWVTHRCWMLRCMHKCNGTLWSRRQIRFNVPPPRSITRLHHLCVCWVDKIYLLFTTSVVAVSVCT